MLCNSPICVQSKYLVLRSYVIMSDMPINPDQRFKKLWDYLVTNRRLRARIYVMKKKTDICSDDFIEHFKTVFLSNVADCAASTEYNELSKDTKALFYIAGILNFKNCSNNYRDAKVLRAVSFFKERALINGLKIAAVETLHLLAPDYKFIFLEKNHLEKVVLRLNTFSIRDRVLVMDLVTETMKDLRSEHFHVPLEIFSRLYRERDTYNDPDVAHNILNIFYLMIKSLKNNLGYMENLVKDCSYTFIIEIVRNFCLGDNWLLVIDAIDLIISIVNIFPASILKWIKHDIQSCLFKLLTGCEIEDMEEMKLSQFITNDKNLINQVIRLIRTFVPFLPNADIFDFINTHDGKNILKDFHMNEDVLKNSGGPMHDFIITLLPIVLLSSKIQPNNAILVILLLRMLYHMSDHEPIKDECLSELVSHLTTIIYSKDIIIKSSAICVATEILKKESRLAIRKFHSYGLINTFGEFVTPILETDYGCRQKLMVSVENQVAILRERILSGKKEAFSSPYNEMTTIRNLLNEGLSDSALRELKQLLLSRKAFAKEDVESSNLAAALVIYFMPQSCTCLIQNSDCCFECRYKRLKLFAKIILNIGDDQSLSPFQYVSLTAFKTFIKMLISCLEKLPNDMLYPEDMVFNVSHNHQDKENIDFDLGRCIYLDWALSNSVCPLNLKTRFVTQVLRLLAISFALSRSVGVLFKVMNYPCLVKQDMFINKGLESTIRNFLRESRYYALSVVPSWLLSNVTKYPFMLPLDVRRNLFDVHQEQHNHSRNGSMEIVTKFEVDRNDFSQQCTLLDGASKDDSMWYITFKNELATGLGPSKEFYSLVSRSYQRFDLNLWMGEKGSDGNVISPCGLFPAPCIKVRDEQLIEYERIGKLLAKSITDFKLLDMPMSNATYKFLLGVPLGLADIKDVQPSTYKFFEKLYGITMEKNKLKETIDSDFLLNEMIDCLNIDGAHFRDLMINFTLPGYPNIELKKYGEHKFLLPQNIEEYFKLVIDWMFNRGTGKQLKAIRDSFQKIVPPLFSLWFYPEELERIFCGEASHTWGLKHLQKYCQLDGFEVHSPSLRFFFEALVSLTSEEQRRFILFVTSCPRLPFSGLKFLHPPLTIKRKYVAERPDDYFPTVNTCTNTIMLPDYSSPALARVRLIMAIDEGLNAFQNA